MQLSTPPLLRPSTTDPVRSAAFFDVDNTILRGSTFLALAKPAWRSGLLRRRALLRALAHQGWFARRGTSHRGLQMAGAAGAEVVRGLQAADLHALMRKALPTHILPRVYATARLTIAQHQRQGEAVFLVSSAPEELVEELARELRADGFVGTRAEVAEGRYTGRLLRFCHGEEKVAAVRELADRHGISLDCSTAYADSATDLPLLMAVGRPICVNPDRRLADTAARCGWEVQRWGAALPGEMTPKRSG